MCLMFTGDKGCVIIDAMDSCESASCVLAAFREKRLITDDSPVNAIIMTHSHFDHANGIQIFR